MSKIRNPKTEASVTCGFFNSLGDRKYDALQMSSLFNGIIRDGIFGSIGTCFKVTPSSGSVVNVGVGKAWFNNTWTYNDAPLAIDCGDADTRGRIDAIVIEVNHKQDIRDNSIKLVTGKPSASPVRPVLINSDSEEVYQYALCYINRPADVNTITDADITSTIGVETPMVTGILEVMSQDAILKKWRGELDNFVAAEKKDMDAFMTMQKTEFDTWADEMKSLMETVIQEVGEWNKGIEDTVYAWFDELKGVLTSDLASTFWLEISTDEIERLLVSGLPDGITTISKDGTVITTTDTHGRELIRTFTNNFMTCTSVLKSSEGGEIGTLVKNFSSDGLTINSEMTILYEPGVVINTLEDGDKVMY